MRSTVKKPNLIKKFKKKFNGVKFYTLFITLN